MAEIVESKGEIPGLRMVDEGDYIEAAEFEGSVWRLTTWTLDGHLWWCAASWTVKDWQVEQMYKHQTAGKQR